MSTALPHRTLPEGHDSVRLGDWNIYIGEEGPEVLGKTVPGWDYEMQLALERKLEIRGEEVAEVLGLDPSTTVRVAVLLSTGTGPFGLKRWPVHQSTVSLDACHGDAIPIRFDVPSRELGEQLVIETLIVLEDPDPDPGAMAATLRSSRLLLNSRQKVLIEGDGARIPISTFEFPAPHEKALWRVVIDPGATLDSVVRAVTRIEVNSRQELISPMLEEKDGPLVFVRGLLSAQIARTIVEFALSSPDELRDAETGDPDVVVHTLASNALVHIRDLFPGGIDEALRERAEERGMFEARFQSRFGGLNRS